MAGDPNVTTRRLGGLACLDRSYPTMAQSWTVSKDLKTCCRAIFGFAVNSDGRLTGDPNVMTVLTPEQCPFLRRASRSSSSPAPCSAPSWRSRLPQPFVPNDDTKLDGLEELEDLLSCNLRDAHDRAASQHSDRARREPAQRATAATAREVGQHSDSAQQRETQLPSTATARAAPELRPRAPRQSCDRARRARAATAREVGQHSDSAQQREAQLPSTATARAAPELRPRAPR
ncbi:hypothetical protein EDB85DRAFT_2155157 [Lactarius pseudohatsudake]|nr:hypothetical protein EDB85DRAFT_2155157 [Lactarius pseudohatsudake]